MLHISVSELKANAEKYIALEEDLLLTQNGKPVAKIKIVKLGGDAADEPTAPSSLTE